MPPLVEGGRGVARPLRIQATDAVNDPPSSKPKAKRLNAVAFRAPARPTGGVSDPALLMLQVDPESE